MQTYLLKYFFVLLILSGLANPAWGGDAVVSWRWSDLVLWVREQGPSARLARLRAEVATSQVEAQKADNSPRILTGASLSRVHEPVTDDLSRSYSRTQMLVGLRWGLLGTREAQERKLLDAQTNQALSEEEGKAQNALLQIELAKAYSANARSQQREQIARAFLAGRSAISDQLKRRTQNKVMLEAERLSLMRLYDEAALLQNREQLAQATALQRISFLTGHKLSAQKITPVGLPANCLTQQMANPAQMHPLLAKAHQAVAWAEERLEQHRYDGIEAGVQVSHALTQDIGGMSGRDTMIGVDISIPWEWQAQKNAQRAQDRGRRDEALEEYSQLVQRFELEFRQAREQWQLNTQHARNLTRQFDADLENLRVARLRLPVSLESGLGQLIHAQHALYVSAIDTVDAAQQQDVAAAELSYYASGCVLQEMPQDPVQEVLAQIAASLQYPPKGILP